ncbi:MAG: hypothetical protein MK179_20470, partial [Pirellulaceae bacterium]|nr:hypothetical protein [Pirellulaceae bacterium]
MMRRRPVCFAIFCHLVLFTAVSIQAQTFVEDFENYIGRTANHGHHWFESFNGLSGEPNYDDSGWMPYFQGADAGQPGIQRDPPIIVAAGGPYSGSPSGYLDTQGASNMDGGPPHGSTRTIFPGGEAVDPNTTVIVQAHANMSMVTQGNSNLYIGDGGIASTDPWNQVSAILISGGGGKLSVGAGGPEPSIPFDWSQGYVQIKVEADISENGFIEKARSYWRPADGGTWELAATIGASDSYPATHVGFHSALHHTFDNFTVIAPEPPVTAFEWNVDASGNWNQTTNWNPNGVPDSRQTPVLFGNTITGNVDVTLDSAFIVNSIEFNNANSYSVIGTGSINLRQTSTNDLPMVTVTSGNHEFVADVNLVDHTTVSVPTSLSFQTLELAGNTLTKTGAGEIDINGTPTLS